MDQSINLRQLTQAEEIQSQIYSKMSYTQKWQEFLKIKEAAWAIKAAGIRSQHPDWEEQKIQEKVRKIFLYATT